MDDNLPVKFAWGVFCRRTITDKETGELSIIDIVPALNLKQINTSDLNTNNLISLGKMYATALFQRADVSDIEINEDLIISFLTHNSEVISVETKITIRSSETSAFINLNLRELVLNVSTLQELCDYKFEVIYKVRDQELGRISLPVNVEIKLLEEINI